jgi:hypothetical protein
LQLFPTFKRWGYKFVRQRKPGKTGIELLDICIKVWGDHIPEVYGLTKTILCTRETD